MLAARTRGVETLRTVPCFIPLDTRPSASAKFSTNDAVAQGMLSLRPTITGARGVDEGFSCAPSTCRAAAKFRACAHIGRNRRIATCAWLCAEEAERTRRSRVRADVAAGRASIDDDASSSSSAPRPRRGCDGTMAFASAPTMRAPTSRSGSGSVRVGAAALRPWSERDEPRVARAALRTGGSVDMRTSAFVPAGRTRAPGAGTIPCGASAPQEHRRKAVPAQVCSPMVNNPLDFNSLGRWSLAAPPLPSILALVPGPPDRERDAGVLHVHEQRAPLGGEAGARERRRARGRRPSCR